MGHWIAAALPVLPGQSDRVRNFAAEIEPHLEEFERLNREATVTRYANWLQRTPTGDVEIVVMEADDPSKIRTSFTDSAYDRWWLGYLQDVHGVDMTAPDPPSAAPMVWEWRAG
ncbi:MAG TPA: hypothetical protein VHL78_13450 [Actinomycetota bacterium]|nr:hypothetical protein [Actinomycetota bacterium]